MWWLIIPAAVVVLAAVLVIRASAFRPADTEKPSAEPAEIDSRKAIDDLAAMIRCKTVSNVDNSLEDAAEFDKFRALLRERFPAVHETCPLERVGRCGLLYKWSGASPASPSVFMAHYDVVPADGSAWSRPPFDGVVEDGVMWGRGTLDTKTTLLGVLEAAEHLIKQGFTPKNDVYFAFSGEEEIAGRSAADIVSLFEERGVVPAMVLDEGGAVVQGVFPGVTAPCALIGTAEKGQMSLYMGMKSDGGHASAPPAHTIVGELAKAVTRIEAHPSAFTLTPPAAEMFDTLGRRSTFAYRLIFANLWLFRPVLDSICKNAGGELNALVRTTVAATQMRASAANNVLAPEAEIGLNVRLIGGDDSDAAIERLRGIVSNPDISFRRGTCSEPCAYSQTEGSAGWEKLKNAVSQTWPEAIVSPYLMIAGSDSRHYSRISRNVYRFCPMELTGAERAGIHGVDEHIPTEKVVKCAEFYVRLMKHC